MVYLCRMFYILTVFWSTNVYKYFLNKLITKKVIIDISQRNMKTKSGKYTEVLFNFLALSDLKIFKGCMDIFKCN